MDKDSIKLKKELRKAGLSDQAIEAAWPNWWSDEAASSASARAELRFTLARRLGISPKPLLGERVEFVWRDNARYKNLSGVTDGAKGAITSFGIALGQHLLRATENSIGLSGLDAKELRKFLLANSSVVELRNLLALCWAFGVPVIHLRVFPLPAKSMHAMVVRSGERFCILLGKDAQYPAPIAFTLAHEIGHIVLGHLRDDTILFDDESLEELNTKDEDEIEADKFALQLLTGREEPDIRIDVEKFNSAQLADAVLRASRLHNIEPGTLALCLAHRTRKWPVAMAALRYIYDVEKPVWREINGVATRQLSWSEMDDDSAAYLQAIMGGSLG